MHTFAVTLAEGTATDGMHTAVNLTDARVQQVEEVIVTAEYWTGLSQIYKTLQRISDLSKNIGYVKHPNVYISQLNYFPKFLSNVGPIDI